MSKFDGELHFEIHISKGLLIKDPLFIQENNKSIFVKIWSKFDGMVKFLIFIFQMIF